MSMTAAQTRTTRTLLAVAVFMCAAVAAAQDPVPQPTTQSPSGRVEPTPAADPVSGPDKYQIDKRLTMFQKIRDDAIFPWADTGVRRLEDAADDKMEEQAYDEVLRYARQFPAAELEAHARRDVLPRDLYTNGRLSYKLDLIFFEGTVRQLHKAPVTELLQASGVTELYEAWMFPDRSQEPICVFVTELPPGMVVPANAREAVNYHASIAGYYFKTLRYESREFDKDEVGKYRTRRAPVLMGRSFTLMDAGPSPSSVWRESIAPLIIAGVAVLAFVLLGLTMYFRRGDAAVRREIDKKLTDNPFAN